MAITGQFAQYLPFPVDYGNQPTQTYGDQADATGKTIRDAYVDALGRAQAANDVSGAATLYSDIGAYLNLPVGYYRRNIEGVTDPATKQYMLTEAQYREASLPTARRIAELTYNPQEKGLSMYDYVPLGSADPERMQEWANKSQAFQLATSVRPEQYATFADYMQAVRQEGARAGALKPLNSGEVEVYAKDWYDHVKSSLVPGYVPTQESVTRGNYTMDDAGNVYFTAAGTDRPTSLGGTSWTRQGGLNAADIYNADSPNAYFGPAETTQAAASDPNRYYRQIEQWKQQNQPKPVEAQGLGSLVSSLQNINPQTLAFLALLMQLLPGMGGKP